MREYEYFVPSKVLFGIHRLDSLGSIIKEYASGTDVALFSNSLPWMQPLRERIYSSLQRENLDIAFTFSDIDVNPTVSQCREGLRRFQNSPAGVAVVMGGGSYIDAAKWILAQTNCELFIAVPTTAGTGSETNEWAVITDDTTHVKNSIQCRAADIALLDPTVTISMPPRLTLFSGMDAFSHGMEAFVSRRASPITDLLSFEGCQKVVSSIETCFTDGCDLESRTNMLEASMCTGPAMLNAGLGILHCIANILPGFYPQYSHGQVCGSLLASTLEYNKEAVPAEKYEKMHPLVVRAQEIFDHFTKTNGVEPITIEREQLQDLVSYASTNVNRHANPRTVTKDDIERLIAERFIIK